MANIHSACALLTVLVPSITIIDHDHSYSRKHFVELNTSNNNTNSDVEIEGSSSLENDIETGSPITSKDVLKVELEHLQFTLSERKMIEQHRKKQSDNPLWYQVHFKKLTGSMSSQGLAQKTWIPYLLQRILYPKSFPFVPATIQWGIDHESTAHTVYTKFMYASNHPTLTLENCGIFNLPQEEWIGASPDAVVVDPTYNPLNGNLEVKCPYSM